MAKLRVKNFSCLQSAELDLGKLTVLIGSQGAGKSLLAKLAHYFFGIFGDAQPSIVSGHSIDEFEQKLAMKFSSWFPVEAWGSESFLIEFECGVFHVSVTGQTSSTPKVIRSAVVHISSWFTSLYSQASHKNKLLLSNEPERSKTLAWRIQRLSDVGTWLSHQLSETLKDDYCCFSIFIPAARSAFMNFESMDSTVDQLQSFDPITERFALEFATLRENFAEDWPLREGFKEIIERFLNGSVHIEDGVESIRLTDGRIVPFPFLSSGQQALVPIVMTLHLVFGSSHNPQAESNGSKSRFFRLAFVEEPEAHLFPHLQSQLIGWFVSLLAGEETGGRLLLTTHSPYILSKLNNLLKAGRLGEKFKTSRQQTALAEIVPSGVSQKFASQLAPVFCGRQGERSEAIYDR